MTPPPEASGPSGSAERTTAAARRPVRGAASGPQRVVMPASPAAAPGLTPPLALVIFGASGDLTSRKILPALANLAERGRLDDRFTVIGVARTQWSDEEFRQAALKAAPDAGARWPALVERFRYVPGEYASTETFDRLKELLGDADRQGGTRGNRVFYLATIPSAFALVAAALARVG